MPSKNKHTLKGLSLHEISLVDDPANVDATVSMFKRRDGGDDAGQSGEPPVSKKGDSSMSDDNKGATLDDLTKQVETLVAENESLKAEIAKRDEKPNEPEYIEFNGERIEKSAVPASVLSVIEAQAADIAKMKADRETETNIAKAKTELPNLAGTDTVKAELYKAAVGIEGALDVLKAADAAVKTAMTETGYTTTHESSALVELDKMAKDYAADKGVDYHSAYAEVTKAGRGAELFAKRHVQ